MSTVTPPVQETVGADSVTVKIALVAILKLKVLLHPLESVILKM